MSMSMISMECPNCGAPVKRKKNAFFAHCPYCGVDVCFDEINEEAKNDIRNQIIVWKRTRNICLPVMGAFCFAAFFLVGASNSDDTMVGIGTVCLIIAAAMFISAPIILGGSYPEYDLLTDAIDKNAKVKMWAKLMFVSFCICLLAVIAAFILLSAMGIR